MWSIAYAANGAQEVAPGPTMSGILPPLLMMMVIFYFLLIRPQQKKQKKRDAMLGELKDGDNVMTTGGIYGTISKIKGNIIILKIAENVKIKVDKSCVSGLKEDAK